MVPICYEGGRVSESFLTSLPVPSALLPENEVLTCISYPVSLLTDLYRLSPSNGLLKVKVSLKRPGQALRVPGS